jgi:hypothetical protein
MKDCGLIPIQQREFVTDPLERDDQRIFFCNDTDERFE